MRCRTYLSCTSMNKVMVFGSFESPHIGIVQSHLSSHLRRGFLKLTDENGDGGMFMNSASYSKTTTVYRIVCDINQASSMHRLNAMLCISNLKGRSYAGVQPRLSAHVASWLQQDPANSPA